VRLCEIPVEIRLIVHHRYDALRRVCWERRAWGAGERREVGWSGGGRRMIESYVGGSG
jgi:hypothetical protein